MKQVSDCRSTFFILGEFMGNKSYEGVQSRELGSKKASKTVSNMFKIELEIMTRVS